MKKISYFKKNVSRKSRKLIFLVASTFLFFGITISLKGFIAEKVFECGNIFFGEKYYNLSIAEKFYKVSLFFDSNVSGAHYQTARIYFLNGSFSVARNEINEEIRLHPDFKRSFYVKGLIDGYDGDFFASIQDFKEFLRWKPESWAAHNDLAWVYFQVGEFEKVAELADDGLKYAPGNPWLLNTKGMALYNLGKKDEAKESLQEALSAVDEMTAANWKNAYPGNDPSFSNLGFDQMKDAIKNNRKLLDT